METALKTNTPGYLVPLFIVTGTGLVLFGMMAFLIIIHFMYHIPETPATFGAVASGMIATGILLYVLDCSLRKTGLQFLFDLGLFVCTLDMFLVAGEFLLVLPGSL